MMTRHFFKFSVPGREGLFGFIFLCERGRGVVKFLHPSPRQKKIKNNKISFVTPPLSCGKSSSRYRSPIHPRIKTVLTSRRIFFAFNRFPRCFSVRKKSPQVQIARLPHFNWADEARPTHHTSSPRNPPPIIHKSNRDFSPRPRISQTFLSYFAFLFCHSGRLASITHLKYETFLFSDTGSPKN